MRTTALRCVALAALSLLAAPSASSAQQPCASRPPIPHPCPFPDACAGHVCVPKPDVKKHIIYASCEKWFCIRRCALGCGLFGHCPDECVQCDRPRLKHVLMKLAVDEPAVKCVLEARPCEAPGCYPAYPSPLAALPQISPLQPTRSANAAPQGSRPKSERP